MPHVCYKITVLMLFWLHKPRSFARLSVERVKGRNS
jgi:hypothetical protein